MAVLEIRRHAERVFERGGPSALTSAGRAAAAALGKRSGPFALVVASPLPRAKETAELVGGRLDAVEPALLPDIGGARLFGDTSTLTAWAALLAHDEARQFAEQQVEAWAALANRVGPRERVLAISHSGLIDLPAVHLALALGLALDGPSFGHLEGVCVTYAQSRATTLEVVRQPAG